MECGVEPFDQGKLDDGNVRVRVHQFERDEHTVVETPFVVGAAFDLLHSEKSDDLARKRRISGGRILYMIRFFRKASQSQS